jgi:Tetratricopeptide repeat
MDRAELEGLDRDALIAHAEQIGVSRARILTRPELVDEVLLRRAAAGDRSARRARGLFGRARDLLARVVELGLNLPEAADLLRGGPPVVTPRPPSAALPTVTLAEIYAAQGHSDRAVATLRDVLAREPDHAEASRLLARLDDGGYVAPPPPLPAEAEADELPVAEEADEVAHVADDSCVSRRTDDGAISVEWALRRETLERAATGELVVRTVVIEPSWDGPRVATRDEIVAADADRTVIRDVERSSVALLAIGWRWGERFVPFAHATLDAS